MTPEMRHSPSRHSLPNGGNTSLGFGISDGVNDDLTPAGSPTNSPILGHRSRMVSMSNPEPVIMLVAEGLIRKGKSMEELLEDRLLISVLEDADGIVKPDHKGKCIERSL